LGADHVSFCIFGFLEISKGAEIEGWKINCVPFAGNNGWSGSVIGKFEYGNEAARWRHSRETELFWRWRESHSDRFKQQVWPAGARGLRRAVLQFDQLSLHDIQLPPKNTARYDTYCDKQGGEYSDATSPSRHYKVAIGFLLLSAVAATVFVTFKAAEYADDYWPAFWWLPLLGGLALASWLANHALGYADDASVQSQSSQKDRAAGAAGDRYDLAASPGPGRGSILDPRADTDSPVRRGATTPAEM
jgi:hypothetical protein